MRRCKQPGHIRVVWKSGKSDCHTCKTSRCRARAAADPQFYQKKHQQAKARPLFKQQQAAAARRHKYGSAEAPSGPCDICRNRRATDVDHDHVTGVRRGHLCRRCNLWLAGVEDKEYLATALNYLSHWHRVTEEGK